MHTNFLSETIECLHVNGKVEANVLWVGRDYTTYDNERITYRSTWDDFCKKADFNYDSGYGGNIIPLDLIVVGEDFWLERHEYDGSEWWEFKTMPSIPHELKDLELTHGGLY